MSAAFVLVILAHPAQARSYPINGSFETGDFAWVNGKRQFHVHEVVSRSLLFGPSAAQEGALRHGRPDRLESFSSQSFLIRRENI